MEYLIGGCIGAIIAIILFPIIIPILFFIAWGLDFIDMELNPTTPPWLSRLKAKIKRILHKA
jgi:hypothetical protein